MAEAATKAGWTRVAFGDVVQLSQVRSRDPQRDGFERYVGLEHLDPGDLKIRRSGNVTEGTTFTNVFQAGHVLFGKRRAYQRKVAVADFSGVCSGDIYVFEPANEHLLPELLPFICQTDAFFEHAIGTSAGSLSPRTNWKSLARYEFVLPPLAEQRRIVLALSSIQDAIDKLSVAAMRSEDLLRSSLDARIRSLRGKTKALGDIASIERGKFSHRPRNLPEFYGGDADFVQTGDVAASRGVLGPASQTLSELGMQYSRSFPPGTVLVTIAAVIGATAVTTREIWCPDSVVGIIPNRDAIDPFFLEYSLRHVRPRLENQEATSSTQKNINLATLRPLAVPVPSPTKQVSVVRELRMVEQATVSLVTRQRHLHELCQLIVEGGTWIS